ncbi:helix-turn-helix domain-containing protein [Methylacidiphilum caldifontis]
MTYKIALDPNNTQATYFARAAGTASTAWCHQARAFLLDAQNVSKCTL